MIWLASELPPDIPPACVVRAADRYAVPIELLVSMLKTENGKVGKAYPRSHGTYLGPSQISDKWVPHFLKWGVTADDIQNDACTNVAAGAYVLAYYRLREKGWAEALARYNVGSLSSKEKIEAGSVYVNRVLTHWWKLYYKWNSNSNATR